MKAKKMLSLVLAVVMLFTVSLMVFTVHAMEYTYYDYATNQDGTIEATGSIQANAYSEASGNDKFFSQAFATLRVDPLVSSVTTHQVSISLVLSVCHGNSIRGYYAEQSEDFFLSSSIRHINLNDYGTYGVSLDYEDEINVLACSYAVYDITADESIYVPDITLSLDS